MGHRSAVWHGMYSRVCQPPALVTLTTLWLDFTKICWHNGDIRTSGPMQVWFVSYCVKTMFIGCLVARACLYACLGVFCIVANFCVKRLFVRNAFDAICRFQVQSNLLLWVSVKNCEGKGPFVHGGALKCSNWCWEVLRSWEMCCAVEGGYKRELIAATFCNQHGKCMSISFCSLRDRHPSSLSLVSSERGTLVLALFVFMRLWFRQS